MMASRGKWLLVILALPIGMMFLLPGVVRGGMWVGVQTGPTYCATADVGERSWAGAGTEKTYKDVKFDVNFLGGLVVGYDFVHEGFLGRAWPSWMKYFSLVLDATYENMSFQHQGVIVEVKGKSTVSGFSPSGTLVHQLVAECDFALVREYQSRMPQTATGNTIPRGRGNPVFDRVVTVA